MPSLVVMKFGGTSVADAERVKRAARRIVDKREAGHQVVAVLSARGKTTDELIAMAEEVSSVPDPREMDMLLSTGERISCALCAMAINDLGHRAISLTGSQAGIVTDESHTKALIIDVRADRIRAALQEDRIVLVAGFQGVSENARNVTTLGRGGSDTSAVAVAAALGAEVCEIYTDVAGVYSADPRIVADARKLQTVSFEEMLEMSASGAGVLQLRSVEYARNHGVRIHCRSSFDDRLGTVVVSEGETMDRAERPLITAVTHSTSPTLCGTACHSGNRRARSMLRLLPHGTLRGSGSGQPCQGTTRGRRDRVRHVASDSLAHGGQHPRSQRDGLRDRRHGARPCELLGGRGDHVRRRGRGQHTDDPAWRRERPECTEGLRCRLSGHSRRPRSDRG
jgi:aspartokinase